MKHTFDFTNVLKMNANADFEQFEAAFALAFDALCSAKDEVDKDLQSAYLDVAKAHFALAVKFYEAGDQKMREAFAEFKGRLESKES